MTDPAHHIAHVDADADSLRRGGSARIAACTCGWRGPERFTLELAADDGVQHELDAANRTLPVRRADETAAQFVDRLHHLYLHHLQGCDTCNYDQDCTACEVEIDGGGHNCNCSRAPADDRGGYGARLRALYEAEAARL